MNPFVKKTERHENPSPVQRQPASWWIQKKSTDGFRQSEPTFLFSQKPPARKRYRDRTTGTKIFPNPHHETFPIDTSHDPDKNGAMKNMPYCFHPVCQLPEKLS
jgi:hypothetical protein